MSGHNKWSKIKHKKAVEDSKKSKEFSKFAQLITIEAKQALGNLKSPGLRRTIERARSAHVPSSNIDRAVKKGVSKEVLALEEVIYEAYGPGGSAMVIYGLTDNKNKSSAEIKHILTKNGLQLAGQGTVLWTFNKKDGEWVAKTIISLNATESLKLKEAIDFALEIDDA